MGSTEFLSSQLVDEESKIKPSSNETFLFTCFPVYDPQKLSQGNEGFSCSFRWLLLHLKWLNVCY